MTGKAKLRTVDFCNLNVVPHEKVSGQGSQETARGLQGPGGARVRGRCVLLRSWKPVGPLKNLQGEAEQFVSVFRERVL